MGIRSVGILGLMTTSDHVPHNDVVIRFMRGLAHTPRIRIQTAEDEPLDEAIAIDLRRGGTAIERVPLPDFIANASFFVIDFAHQELRYLGYLTLIAATGKPVRTLWVRQRERDAIEFLRGLYELANVATFVDPEAVLTEIVRG